MNPPAAPLFPATAWTLVRRVQQGGAPRTAEQALNSLCTAYWEPVRKYLIALGCREQETADVTQEFFASFLRGGGFDKADPSIAKLRTFIKHAATRFLQNHWRKQLAGRRGGGQVTESLEQIPEMPAEELAQAERCYDLEWAQTVLNRALTALEQSYAARGKAHVFDAVKSGLLRAGGAENTPDIASRLGIAESQVRLAVHRARQRLADTLRSEVSATIETGCSPEEEVRYLLGVIAQAQ